jgi:tetratricopeptide (TPR) repeat protein
MPPDFERRWQLLVAWHLQHELDISSLALHLDTAIRRFPRDGEMLLALGSFYELVGWSREPMAQLDTLPPSAVLRPILDKTQKQIRQQAMEALRRAVAVSPQLEEAHLRLGRVATELGGLDEARKNIDPLRAGSGDKRFRYLANLFMADAEQRASRLAPSAQAYRDAAQLYPACPTPWVGLTTVLRAQGDRAAALATTRRIAEMSADCDDPWWSYKFGQAAWRLEPLARQLRLEVSIEQ